MSGRIPRWATRHQQKRVGRLSNLTAPRPTHLPHPKPTTVNPKDSRYERGTTGGQVNRFRKVGKPYRVIITEVARKLVTIANALCKSRQKWAAPTS